NILDYKNKIESDAEATAAQNELLENILSNNPALVYVRDTDLKFTMVNNAFEKVIQKSSDCIIGKTDFDIYPEDIAKKMTEDDIEVMNNDRPKLGIEENLLLPDGKNIWVIANKIPLHDKNGEVKGIVGISYDISEIKEIELQLRTILDNFPYKAWLKDINGKYLAVNDILAKSANKIKSEMIGKTDMEIYPEELAKKYMNDDRNIMETRESRYFQEISLTNGKSALHETYKTPVINEVGEVIGTTGYTKDISKMQEELKELTRLNNLFSAVIDNIPIMLFVKDADTLRFKLINKAAEEVIGLGKNNIIGKDDYDLFPKEQADFFVEKDREALNNNKKLLIEEENLTSSKKSVTIRTKKVPILDENENPICIVGISEDITKQRQMERTIKELAYYDEITKLPNRHLFKDRFEIASEYSIRNKKKMMISMLDFDKFKIINDRYGHVVGDKLLKSFADRVKKIMRKTDTFARFGGDEFIFIISGFADNDGMKKFADKILYSFNKPFKIGDLELDIKGSMGISIFPDDAAEQDILLKFADTAMYEAKKKGGNTYVFYETIKKGKTSQLFT
ncbi:MAG: PAS domain-containing protein, partial [Actinomycetota bacterium]|nr:PAS domain-containing protein [Actinomycetota bacterium]